MLVLPSEIVYVTVYVLSALSTSVDATLTPFIVIVLADNPVSFVIIVTLTASPTANVPDVGENVTLLIVGVLASIMGVFVANGEVVKVLETFPAASARIIFTAIVSLSATSLSPSEIV